MVMGRLGCWRVLGNVLNWRSSLFTLHDLRGFEESSYVDIRTWDVGEISSCEKAVASKY
jgi:hypothetical protein